MENKTDVEDVFILFFFAVEHEALGTGHGGIEEAGIIDDAVGGRHFLLCRMRMNNCNVVE